MTVAIAMEHNSNNNNRNVSMSSAAKREARLKAAAALEEASSSDRGNSSRTSRRMSAAATAISTTPLLVSKPSSTSDATTDRTNRRTRLQKSNSKRGGLGGRSGSSRKLAVDDDYSDGDVEPSRESKREARMRAASKLSEAEEAKSTNSGRARRPSLAATLSGDSQSRRSRLEKSGSMRVSQRGNSSRGLGRRGNSSRKLTVDSDEEEEIVEEETFKSKPSSRPRIPRRTTSMEDFQNNAVATTEPNRRRPLQRHKSADGSSMPFKRGQRRPSLALVDRSSSVRRGLGGPGGGGLSRGNSQRRLNDALEDIDNSNDENPRGPTSRRRRDGTSPGKDNSNQGSTSLRRGPRRTLSSDSASIGNSTNTNTSARRARRGSGMIDDSSNRRLGIGRSMSGLEDSSSGRRGVSRNNSGGMIDDSSAVNGKSGGSRRRDGGMRRSGSGGTLDESSNINNSASRRRGVGRSASGIGGSDAMRRRQTQRFVEKVSSIDDDDDEEDDFDVAPQDGVLHGRGLGDSTRRRREPTLSRMSINDLRSRLQGTPEEEEAKAAKAKVMGESSQGGDETSEGDIWSTANVPAPLKSSLNDD